MGVDRFKTLIKRTADVYRVNPYLVAAIVSVESGWEPLRVRYELEWRYFADPVVYAKALGITEKTERVFQACSFGLMQVMGTVYREQGYKGHLSALPGMTEMGLDHGCLKLQALFLRYGDKKVADVVSAYNAGTARVKGGQYSNQSYVDEVVGRMDDLQQSGVFG